MKIELNKNNIKYLGSDFQGHFSDTEFKVPKKLKLQHKVLNKYTLDEEILKEFKPQESTLGELIWALNNYKGLIKNGWPNIFYIRDKDNVLWAVGASWGSFLGGWSLSACSVTRRVGWDEGDQVVSQNFNVSSNKSGSRIIEILDDLDKLAKELRTLV